MGNYYGSSSKKRLETLHPDNQKVLTRALVIMDHSIICGHRGEKDQNKAFEDGFSQLKWPDSSHNAVPSNGFDVAPFPIRWDDINRFCELAGVILAIAHEMGIKLKWGGHWPRFKDYGHFERVP